MYKSWRVMIGLILGMFIAVLNLTTCQTLSSVLREPVLTLHSAELGNISFTGVQLLCKVNVENPNPFSIPFPDIDWEFFVNTNSFVHGQIKANQSIKARTTTVVDVPVNFSYLEVFNTFASLKDSKQADYKVSLAAKFSIPILGDRTWHFEHEGVFPVLQLPKLSAPSMKIDHLDFTKADLLFTVNVENPNPFDLPSPKMAYDYFVNNNSFIKSSIPLTAPLAAGAVTAVPIMITVNYADLYKTFQALRNLGEAPCLFSLKSDFSIPAFADESRRTEIPCSLPMLKVPTLSFNSIRVKNLSLTKIDFELLLEAENANNFAMILKDLSYGLTVNNSQWVSSKVSGTPQIAANKKTLIPMGFSISGLAMIKDITEIITKGTNVTYTCTGNFNIGSTLPGLDDLKTPFNFSGSTKLIR